MVVETSQTYDKKNIEKWLTNHDTDPVTGLTLKSKKIVPNCTTRHLIEEYFLTDKVNI